MSLTDLQTLLIQQATQAGAVTLDAATFTAGGMTVEPGLDTLIQGSFNLGMGTLTPTTTPAQIGTVTGSTLTMTGNITALGVTMQDAKVVFTADGTALTFTIDAPLGSWTFHDSFPFMAGFPYDNLTLAEPAFVFSSDRVASYPWAGYTLTLAPGLTLASTTEISGFLQPILGFVSGFAPSIPLLFAGPLNPAGVDGNVVLLPQTDLNAVIQEGPIAKVGFLQLQDAGIGVQVANLTEDGELVQAESVFFAVQVALGDDAVLDCQAQLYPQTSVFQIMVASDPAKPLTLETIFNVLMGGNSWYPVIPQPLQFLFTSFGFKNFTAMVGTQNGLTLQSVSIMVGSTRPWQLYADFTIQELDLTWTIRQPLAGAQMSGLLTADFQFYPDLFQGAFSVTVTSTLLVSGSFEGTVSFTKLVSTLTAGYVQIPSSFQLDFTSFGLLLDPTNKAYGMTAGANASLDVLGTGKISLTDLELALGVSTNASTGKTQSSASVSGLLGLGDAMVLSLAASYDGAAGLWHFEGGLAPGSSIAIGTLLDTIFEAMGLPSFVPGDLSVTPLWLTVDTPTAPGAQGSYSLNAGVEWAFTGTPLGDVEIAATLLLAYDGTKTDNPYNGIVTGEFTIATLNADVVLGYQFQQGNQLLFVQWAGFTATYDVNISVITFSVGDWTLGGLVSELVRMATNQPDFSLPTPWDLLNQISLKGFSVAFNLDTGKVTANYAFSGNLDLFFITIQSITFTKDATGVNIGLTARLVTDTQFTTYDVDPVNGTAPAVPGQDTTPFDLQLLALGQRVTIPGIPAMTQVSDVIAALQAFQPGAPGKIPVSANPAAGQPVYDAGSNWLVGTHFQVLKDKRTGIAMLDLQAVFNDPALYALRIAMAGPSAKIFAGLVFEIMYRKVTDTIGVYEIVLQLPTAMRTLEFGAVSITLPTVSVQVYTNGNFLINFGFPANLDFSQSFTIQAFPFMGSGGFYFGLLSGATSSQVPQTTRGTFDPVIVFGIGLQVGLGKSINEGVLSAQLSVAVFGIVEGVIARWHPYDGLAPPSGGPTQVQGAYYYWLQGTVGIIGKVQGSVDFAIISATLSITVTIQAQITLEAYRAIPVSVSVGVRVELSLKVNLGLFKITIHFSFSYTVQVSFTIGSNSTAPWDEPTRLHGASPTAARVRGQSAWALAAPSFAALAVEARPTLTLFLAPHLTLADAAGGGSPAAAYVAMLYIQAPVDDGSGGTTGPLTCFELLAEETFVWAATTFSGAPDGVSRSDALDQVLSLTQVSDAYAYFAAEGSTAPVTYPQIKAFLSAHFVLEVVPPPSDEVPGAAVFPMIPDLTLAVTNGTTPVITSAFGQYPMADPTYLEALQDTLSELAVELTTELENQYATAAPETRAGTPQPETLPTLVVQDYFALIARQTLQAACDAFANYAYAAQGGDTLQSIVTAFNQIGAGSSTNTLTVGALATANRTVPLAGAQHLTLSGVVFPVQSGLSFNAVAALFNLQPSALATANLALTGLIAPGVKVTIAGAPYATGANDSFATIQAATHASLDDVLAGVGGVETLLIPLAPLPVPAFAYATAAANTDTLEGIANAYGLALADVATANPGTSFYLNGSAPQLDIPGLRFLSEQQLVDAMRANRTLAHTAGMCSRFLLNGLRLPIDGDLTLAPDSPYTGQAAGGLYGVMGQQFTLPALTSADADAVVVTLSAPQGTHWVTFAGGGSSLAYPVDGAQIDAVNAVLAAAAGGLVPRVTSIAALDPAAEGPTRFSFQSSTPLQLPVPLPLPNGAAATQAVPSPTVWNFSQGLLALLAQPSSAPPLFSLQVGSHAGATQVPVNTPASNFGWATLLDVSLKVVPSSPISGAAAANVYQLVGTDSTGTVLLERLLTEIGLGTASPIVGLYLLFSPNPTSTAPQGLAGADPATQTAFIVQANLSTETNPPQSSLGFVAEDLALAPAAPDTVPGVLNAPGDFVRLLWEISIVQSGGFYLYYAAAGDSATPLPGNLFDGEGAGTIQLLVVYGETGGALAGYMNAVAVNDRVDAATSVLFAQSAPNPVTYAATPPDTLAGIAARYHLTPVELAWQLAGVTLVTGSAGATLTIAGPAPYQLGTVMVSLGGPTYLSRSGDTLASIATRFGMQQADVQGANPGVDFGSLAPWTLLTLPDTAFTLSAGAQYTTLGGIAAFYGMEGSTLALPNLEVAGLFGGTLDFDDQVITVSSVVPPGVAGVTVDRTPLGDDQTDPAVYLDATFNLLGWQLSTAQGFKPSPAGTPVGPTDSMSQDDLLAYHTLHPMPAVADGTVPLYYEQLFPVAQYAPFNPLATVTGHVPPGASNPYAGVGATAQVRLAWQDLFGNVGNTPLTDPALDPDGAPNGPPVFLGYTDALLALGQWPGVSSDYLFQLDGATPTLYVTLSFDTCRYQPYAGDTSDPPSWKQRALADHQTYAGLYYQLNQTDAGGTPHVTFTVQTTLEPGVTHTLAGNDLGALTGFVTQAWQYLDDLLSGAGKPAPAPFPLHLAQVVAASNPADLYLLQVAFSIVRGSQWVHPDFREQVGVARAAALLTPRLLALDAPVPDCADVAPQPLRTLQYFACQFEAAYATGAATLHIGTGPDRTAAAVESSDRPVWVLRLATGPGGTAGIQLQGPAVFYAPPPLSVVPISRTDAPVYAFDPTTGLDTAHPMYPAFKDVDLDTWGSQALGAIDLVLSSGLVVPAYLVDEIGATSHLDSILQAKSGLAAAVAGTVTNVLQDPATLLDGALADAQEKLEQQMLITLASAYTVGTVVQFPVQVNATDETGFEPPVLYGVPVITSGDGNDGNGAAPEYTLSTYKVGMATGTSFLSFLFSTRFMESQSYVELTLSYPVTNVEHQIGEVPGIKGYQASTWLSFPNALPPIPLQDPALATVQIPVVLRAYPPVPVLGSQVGLSAASDSTAASALETARTWDYEYTFSSSHAAQDQVGAISEFNLAPAFSAFADFVAGVDLFTALAQLIAVWPQLKQVFLGQMTQVTLQTPTTAPAFVQAQNALAAFDTLTTQLAASWQAWTEGRAFLASPADSGEVAQASVSYTITESHYPAPDGADLLVTITPGASTIPAGLPPLPSPQEVFTGYSTAVPTDGGVRYRSADGTTFLSWEEAQNTAARTVTFDGMDVTAYQNALSSVFVTRNADLVPQTPTPNPTRGAFVYQTPLVAFPAKLTPLLTNGDPIMIESIETGSPRTETLVAHLQALFSTFFANATSTAQPVKLGVAYQYTVGAAGSGLSVQVPLGLAPWVSFAIPGDWSPGAACPTTVDSTSPFVCQLAASIQAWFSANQPSPAGGVLLLDLSVFSSLDGGGSSAPRLPLIRLTDLQLTRAYVSDL